MASLRRRRSTSDFLRMQAQRGGGTDWVFNEIFAHLQNDLAHQRCVSSSPMCNSSYDVDFVSTRY